MHLYPTHNASHLAVAGVAVAAVGVVAQEPAIVGWGGALVVAVALARAVTLVQVARIRAAGFEMLWSGPRRMLRAARGATVEIEAEVRNRDTLAARYVKLRAVASPNLVVEIEPNAGEVAASGRLKVKVRVKTPRVGQHGLHGLALEVHGAPGMFEVPLTFANPYGIEVMPRPFTTWLWQPRGGRSRLTSPAGRPGRSRGDGSDLRELREHQPGDPFRRIAWKASARRGMLLVRDFEREERDVLWVVVDASVELWAGPIGRAPLDLAIDEAAAVATRHLSRGDRVGLCIFAAGQRVWIPPDQGPGHAQKIAHALTVGASTYDETRSDLDELDVAVRVLEHLRPLDPRGLVDVRRGDLDRLAQRADAMRARAPFAAPAPEAKSVRERALRRYLACYGIDSPPRIEPDRKQAGDTLVRVLGQLARGKARPSLVHVVGVPPDGQHAKQIGDVVRRLTRGGAVVTWSMPQHEAALEPPWSTAKPPISDMDEPPLLPPRPDFDAQAPISAEAVLVRARTAQARGEAALRKLGVRVVKLVPRRVPVALAEPEPTEPPASISGDVATS
jgi:uncharacterized protein (DUF58 family)